MNELGRRFEQLSHFNSRLDTFSHEKFGDMRIQKNKVKEDTIELVSNQIYDRIIKLINDRRKRSGIKAGGNIDKLIVNYDSFNLDDDGNLTFTCKNRVIDLGNIREGLKSPSKIVKKLGVNGLRSMGFINLTDEDIQPYRPRYKDAREKVRKLNENLNERSKEVGSSSTTDAEAIELMEMTS